MRKAANTSIRIVVFDWAGTLIDFGSLAPVQAMVAAFEIMHVRVSAAQARWAMRGRKREQIETLLRIPEVLRAFERAHGRGPNARDVERLHAAYLAAQLAAIPARAELIDGALASFRYLREREIAIATITDYGRPAHQLVLECARTKGFRPDHASFSDDACAGGSEPFLLLSCMEALHFVRPREVLLVGDAVRDIEAARHVGCMSVGVAGTGDEVGMPAEAWSQLPVRQQNALLAHAHRNLRDAGADFVIDSLYDLPLVIERIAQRRLSSAA